MTYNVVDIIVRIFFILCLFPLVVIIIKLYQASRFEKRIEDYSMDSIKKDDKSYFDRIYTFFLRVRHKLSSFLKGLKIFNSYSEKYEQYTDKTKIIQEEPMDYISNKFLVGVGVIIIVLLSDVFQYKPVGALQIIISFLIGFFLPDLFLLGKKQLLKRQMEANILKAVIIMNNAFKSGRSTMQAIEIAADELEGPIKDEFRKMYIDLSYGLSVENTFKRFAKRVDIEEVRYITTSLAILNKTGGNIVKVFSSIERSFFDRRKMDDELKSLTASANLMFWILISIPLFVVAVISIVNFIAKADSYFLPLVSSPLGFALLGLIFILYIFYIYIVRKIMRVRW